MANVRKPNVVKLMQGTARPDRAVQEVDLPRLEVLPPPPDWLPNVHARNEYERLGPILLNVGLLTEAGISAFGQMCSLHGKIVQLWAAGESPTGHMISQYRNLVNDFGLTPVAQGKVKPIGEQKGNKFSQFSKPAAGAP